MTGYDPAKSVRTILLHYFTTSISARGHRADAYCFALVADSAGMLNFMGRAPDCFTIKLNNFVFAFAGALLMRDALKWVEFYLALMIALF